MTGRAILRSGTKTQAAPVWLEFPRDLPWGFQAKRGDASQEFFWPARFSFRLSTGGADEIFFPTWTAMG